MAFKYNDVQPTEIIVKRSDQEPISFASGSKYVTPKTLDNEGYWIAEALFTQHTDFTLGNIVYCNGEELTSYPHVMHTITEDNTTYTFSAAYHESTSQIYTTQKVVKRIKSNAGLTVYGENYIGMFTADTNLTVLKYGIGLTAVWGKPFSLTIQAGANTTVTVRRTSSPNQHASDGNITSGGIVYYGDIIIVKVTPINSCRLTTFTINGTEYASNQTTEVEQVVTITEAVSIVTEAENAGSWHTYWTGSSTYGFDTIHMEAYTTANYFTTDNFSPTFSEQIPVRITGSFYVGNNAYGGGKPTRGTFADKELPYNTGTNGTSYAKVELQSTSAGYKIYITCHTDGYLNSYVSGGLSQITITKIDIFT